MIVDPQGKAYRAEQNRFVEVSIGTENRTALSELFKELRADDAAAKRENAHPWYGKASLNELLADKSPPEPTQVKQPDQQAIRQMLDKVEAVNRQIDTAGRDKNLDESVCSKDKGIER